MTKPQTITEIQKKILPLTETTFYILVSLVEPLHGYGVMQKVAELTHARVQLGPGTLYGALSNLLSLGLIESVDDDNDERRKLYRMTENGRHIAAQEIQRFEELARNGRILIGK